jgi:hypothetical protein
LLGRDAKGNEIFLVWSAEEIIFVTTDAEGYNSYNFVPFTVKLAIGKFSPLDIRSSSEPARKPISRFGAWPPHPPA